MVENSINKSLTNIPPRQVLEGVEVQVMVSFASSGQQLKEVMTWIQLCQGAEGVVQLRQVPGGVSQTTQLPEDQVSHQEPQVCLLSKTCQMTTEVAVYLKDNTAQTYELKHIGEVVIWSAKLSDSWSNLLISRL